MNSHGSSHSALDSFKTELRNRDDLIEKLRKDILALEEKRDLSIEEVRISNSIGSKYF